MRELVPLNGINKTYSCNQDKFQAMSLGPRHKKMEMNLNIKDINVKSSPGIDLLGVAIDDELNFTKHINNVVM